MRQEAVDDRTLEAARARAWDNLTSAAAVGCAEFRPEFRAYLSGTLTGSRRVLMDDHLSRCSACRVSMAEMKGERRVIPMPHRPSSRWVRWRGLGAAAALVLSVLYLGRGTIDTWLAPGGPRATVVSATGGLYRLPGDTLGAGAVIGERELIRTGPGAHAVLRLADGSTVDVNERTELFVTAALTGRTIHLQHGDVIVRAAEQRRGLLRVLTRDSIAAVKGTVFAVSAGIGGSVVSVVEGAVAVNQPGRNVVLSPGQQAASNPALATSVQEAIAWSPDSEAYLELLASFVKIESQLAEMSPVDLRADSALLAYLPAGAFVYGAIPNLGGKIGQALLLAEQQALENAAFASWWNSETGLELRQIVNGVQVVSGLLGDEVVFCIGSAGPGNEVPMVISRVQPGKRTELASALEGLFAGTGEPVLAYSVTDDLMIVSSSPTQLAWALGHLGQGAGSPFAAAIGERYQRGAGWLIGVDAGPVIEMASGDDAPPVELAAMVGVKYLFVERRAPAGAEENEVTLVFQGARQGMASWLADAGSGGAAEYLPADALLAGYVSMREPSQLFQEFTALMTKEHESFETDMAQVNEKLGPGYLEDLSAAFGTEAAFALNGFSVNGPMWVMSALVYNPPVIDSSLRKLMDTFNAELAADEQDKRILFEQETAGGRVWSTMKAGALPFGLTWTYDRGYMVAASDRAAAERAIATRNGGAQLVWSPEFLDQLPSSAGIHPAAFGWLNAKGALGLLSGLIQSPSVKELLAAREPTLVVFDGAAERIHAASRARLAGVIMDMMLLERLSGAGEPLQ
ncbi:MAG TPA: FecR domain-containing protein [Vicinamibacterales bacterium]|nr:FecR domain-containing protein [Vicinamibacterales bacterium]